MKYFFIAFAFAVLNCSDSNCDESVVDKLRRATYKYPYAAIVAEYDGGQFRIINPENGTTIAEIKRSNRYRPFPFAYVSPSAKWAMIVDGNRLEEQRNSGSPCMMEIWDLGRQQLIFSTKMKDVEEIGDNYFDMESMWLDDDTALIQWNWRNRDAGPYRIDLSLFDLKRCQFSNHSSRLPIGESLTVSPDKRYAICRARYTASLSDTGGVNIGGNGIARRITIVDLRTLKIVTNIDAVELIGKNASFYRAIWIDSGESFATIGSDNNIYRGYVSGKQPVKIVSHADCIVNLRIDETSKRMTSCSADGEIVVYDVGADRTLKRIAGPKYGVSLTIFIEDSLFVGTSRGEVCRAEKGGLKSVYNGSRSSIRAIEKLKGRSYISITHDDGSRAIFDTKTNTLQGDQPGKDWILLGNVLFNVKTSLHRSIR